jgi:hypothetical protein
MGFKGIKRTEGKGDKVLYAVWHSYIVDIRHVYRGMSYIMVQLHEMAWRECNNSRISHRHVMTSLPCAPQAPTSSLPSLSSHNLHINPTST